jgi:hypothetical protein
LTSYISLSNRIIIIIALAESRWQDISEKYSHFLTMVQEAGADPDHDKQISRTGPGIDMKEIL